MKFLLDIPLVMKVAEWIWGSGGSNDDKNSSLITSAAAICVDEFPYMQSECWTKLIVKGLGIAVILGSFLNKAPIIVNIISSKSSEGLSRTSLYGEIIMYTNCALYGILEGHPLTAFGENIALLLQSLVIVYLVWTLSTKSATPVSLQEKSLVVTCLIGYITVNNMFLPEMYRYLLMSSNLPILLYSRGSQILETYRIQHTGAQSIVTLTMNFVGGLIRILTTIQEVGWDIAVLAGYGLSLLLTSTLFIQYFYYQANTAKFIADLKVQVDKKQQ